MRRFVFLSLCCGLWLGFSFTSPTASAFPGFNRPIGVKVWDGVYHPATDNISIDSATVRCLSHNDQAQSFQDLIHKIAFVDRPDRECADHYQKRVGMSKAEYFQKYGATGRVQCPDHLDERYTYSGSGSFVCSNDVVAMSLHNFIDFDTGGIIARPSECKILIVGPDGHQKSIPLSNTMLGGADIFKKGLTNAQRKALLEDAGQDWAVVKTSAKASGVTPYTVFEENPLVKTDLDDKNIIAVSGPQADMKCNTLSVGCSIRNVYNPSDLPKNWPRGVLSDCDTTVGASGGADLQKINGKFALVAIHSESESPGEKDAKIKWFKDSSRNAYKGHHNSTHSVVVERNFKDAIAKLCEHPLSQLPQDIYDDLSAEEPMTVGHK